MVEWDRNRYDELQDSAWALELLANEPARTNTPQNQQAGDRNRAEAAVLRQDAAYLLARFWAANAPSHQIQLASDGPHKQPV